MPVDVKFPTQKADPLDKLLKGLQIANSIYGMKVDMAKVEEAKRTSAGNALKAEQEKTTFMQGQEKIKNEKAGHITQGQFADRAKDFDQAKPNAPGAFKEGIVGPDGNVSGEVWWKRKSPERAAVDPNLAMERRMKREATEKELKDGKQLPAALINTLNDGTVAEQQAAALDSIIEEAGDGAFGPVVGRVRSWNPYDQTAQTMQSKLKTAKQSIGKFLEGGVLRKEDEAKYDAILPAGGDTPEVARQKAINVNALIQAKKAANMESFRAQGYNIAGMNSSSGGQSAQGTMANEDGRAVQWALANPNDPKATQILKLNKVNQSGDPILPRGQDYSVEQIDAAITRKKKQNSAIANEGILGVIKKKGNGG
jgi:hypothetical protein